MPTCWQTFEATLLVNVLANMLARFAIGTNMLEKKKKRRKMLANIVSQTHMLARFAIGSNMLASILDFERFFECFCSNFEQV